MDRGGVSADQLQQARLHVSGLENRLANVKLDVKMSSEKLVKEEREQTAIQVPFCAVFRVRAFLLMSLSMR